MSKQQRLFLLDAYALIFRGYYAFIKNPRINSKGMDTSAIMGFMNSLLDVIRREKPDHLAVAFDKGGSKVRSEMFEAYKANRDETPEAIKIAVPYIQEILKAMHIPIVEKAGFEADDLIGTLSKQAEREGFAVYMVTPDKDFAQLVSENIFMYRPARMGNGIEIWGIPEVQEKFEVSHPEQVIDFLGMMGDAVDNIPGLPGVGEKTAKKFIATYGSMEALLENTHELKGKIKEKIEENKALGLLSKKLATILLDAPVQFDEKDFQLDPPDIEKVENLFQELEFRRMTETFQRIFGNDPAPKSENKPDMAPTTQTNAVQQFDLFHQPGSGTIAENSTLKNLENTPHHYQAITTPMALNMMIKNMMLQTHVCFDTETTSLNAIGAELVGIAFSWEAHKGYYVPFPDDKTQCLALLETLKPFFEAKQITKIGQNLKYDIKVLANYNIEVQGPFFDTMLAHYLINPDMRHNMDVLAETYLGYQPQPISSLIGKKGKNQKSMREVPLASQVEYAVEDADITFQLHQHFQAELEKAALHSLFEKIELPLMPVLADMERTGIRIDSEYLSSLSKQFTKEADMLEQKIYAQAGETFNLASPKQLGVVLFENMKLVEKPKKTKTGQYSTAEDVLSYLAKDHEIIANILEWRSLQKLISTYVDALPKEVHPKTGRVHTIYNQAVAATGRLSSNHPNLQNIPIRTTRGREIRRAFIAKDDQHCILAADYSQIELRIIAALSEDQSMIEAFLNKQDIHAATASKVFGVPLNAVTREQRSHAKTVNFGIIYGVSAFGLSNQTSLSRAESKDLIETYFETYPALKQYISNQVNLARENGYVETVMGRRRYLKDIHSRNQVVRGAAERNAVNAPIQGSAADIIKLAMLGIHQKMKAEGFSSKMLLQVHDELVFEVALNELESLTLLIRQEMEQAFPLKVPLEVEIGTGPNWLSAH